MVNSPKQILKTTFGYDSFREHQEEIIQHVLDIKDCFVLMPTGGGKSLCYQIPALKLDGTTLVVSPLISLMKDQVQALKANGVNADYINSSLTPIEEQAILNQAINNELKLLYLSPEKLISVASTWLTQLNISLIAIDEAHCISMWGHDFRPEYTQMKKIRKQFSDVPFMALTATADKITRKDIVDQLGLVNSKTFISSFNRENLSLNVRSQVAKKDKVKQIVNFINERKNESGIIYCLSRKNTEEITQSLNDNGIPAKYYHAGMNPQKREETQEQFINDDVKIIVATIAFGMGIDKSNVRWVIHNNLPKNIEGYYQEIGRAGRDGLPSDTILYFNYRDLILLTQFAQQSGQNSIQEEKLKRMQQFAEATSCRRQILLAYFGEHLAENCGNCDVCLNPPSFFDGTIIAQKALSATARLKEKVSVNMLINVLRGSQNAEIVAMEYFKVKTYGQGKEYSFFDWQNYIIQLVNKGLLEIDYQNSNNLKITTFGWEIIKEGKSINLTVPEKFEAKKGKKKATKRETNANGDLFETLRQLRQRIAKEEKVPAYIIFNDKSLKEMASDMPETENQFLAISGVGMQKFESFGEEFIESIKKFKGNNKPTIKKHTSEVTFELYNEGLLPEEISIKRGLQLTTIYSHLSTLYEKGKEINLKQFISNEEVDKIKPAYEKLGKEELLKPIFEELKEEVPYHKIRLAISILKKM
jgi:ATP-dependent DNA helicase RecQ